MDILFFSINIIGCLVYFLFSFKSHQSKRQVEQFSNDEMNDLIIGYLDG
jgi:hypothetical protein